MKLLIHHETATKPRPNTPPPHTPMATMTERTVLSLLRSLGATAPVDLGSAIRVAIKQAALLRHQVTGGQFRSLDALAAATAVSIHAHGQMPVPAVAFIGRGQWQIHVADSLTPNEQLLAAARELKFVIDHNSTHSHQPGELSDAEREYVAACFAELLLDGREP